MVLAAHNRARSLERLLASLRAQTIGTDRFEVIVVDDGSSDDTPAVLATEQARGVLDLHVIRHDTSSGPARARNEGWRTAGAPLVAFTDDDCVATPGWLEAGLAALRAVPGGFVQGQTEPSPDELADYGPFTHTLRIDVQGPYYETCNIFYPREILERHGGFDAEAFSMPGGEDTDLAWKAIRAGSPVSFEPEALVYHEVQPRGPMGMLRKAAHWHETVLVFKRYPEVKQGAMVKHWFWKDSHYLYFRALLGLLLPRRWPWIAVRRWLALPYITYLYYDNRRAAGLRHVPYILLEDTVEIAAMIRGAVRYRTFVL